MVVVVKGADAERERERARPGTREVGKVRKTSYSTNRLELGKKTISRISIGLSRGYDGK